MLVFGGISHKFTRSFYIFIFILYSNEIASDNKTLLLHGQLKYPQEHNMMSKDLQTPCVCMSMCDCMCL